LVYDGSLVKDQPTPANGSADAAPNYLELYLNEVQGDFYGEHYYRQRTADDQRSVVWNGIEDARHQTPECGALESEKPQRHSSGDGDDGAGEDLDHQEPLNLSRDVTENLHGDLFLRQRRPDNFDELPLEEIVLEQHEVRQEEEHDDLVDD